MGTSIVNIRNSTFTENSIRGTGPGVISCGEVDLYIYDSKFIGNEGKNAGVLSVALANSKVWIENSVFLDNNDPVDGNDIFISGRNITTK